MLAEQRGSDLEPFWLNTWFGGFDAISLYTVFGLYRPSRYIEVGSGISTRFARKAIRDLKLSTQIISIDPAPRAEIAEIADVVISTSIEDYDFSAYSQLRAGDVIMLDGSHRSFQNSDVTVFFTEILPSLEPGVIVGVHDIFLPFDYPEVWRSRFYNEQYVLAAYLLGGHRANIILPVYYVSQTLDLFEILSPVWNDPIIGGMLRAGGMLWFTNS
jgi:hypothetical protein